MVFWRWFAAKAEQLRSAYGADDLAPLVAEVEAGLARLGPGVRWEVGPFDEAGEVLFFALGAAGDRDRLRRNREVVAGAPSNQAQRRAISRRAGQSVGAPAQRGRRTGQVAVPL